jgi:hypothetical protein
VEVTGNGTPGSPYVVSAVVDPAETNELSCGEDGLYVGPPTIAAEDTDCIALTGTGSGDDPLTADPIIDPNASNLLECENDGLRVILNTAPSDCVTLTGDGTLGDPLIPEAVLSADVGNMVECRADGLFVPAVSQGSIDYRATQFFSGACACVIAGAAIGVQASTFIDYDIPSDVVGLTTHECGATGPYPNSCIEVPIGGGGVYLVQATMPGWSIAPPSSGDIILRLRLWRGTTAGGTADGIGQTAQTRYTTTDSDDDPGWYNTPFQHVSCTLVLADEDVIMADFAVEDYNGIWTGTTLDSAPYYGAGDDDPLDEETAGLPFIQVTRLGDA